MHTKKFLTASRMLLLLPLLYACEEEPDVFIPPDPGQALIYAYPADGMVDLPTGSKMVLTFSSAINASAITAGCEADGDNYVGPICLVDSMGELVDLSSAQLTNRKRTLTFSMKNLREGEEYRLWLSNRMAKNVVNLGGQGPVLTFRTRQYASVPNAAPAVLAINMEKPEVYLPDSGVEGRFPFMDFAPVRLTFTEPLVQTSVQYGSTVKLEHLLRDAQGELTGDRELVEVNLLSERQYITLDPRTDLIGGETYQVTLSGVEDFDEDAVADVTYEFVPLLSKASVGDANPEIRQLMKADPTLGEAGYPSISRLHGEPLNQFNLETVALGTTRVDTKPVTLEGWLGRPSQFPDATPVVARAGQQLRITGIDPIKLGGEVDTKISSGDIIGTFVTDVTGFLTKNPYRPKGVNPDDELAPLHVYMDFDLAMHAENPDGNGSINQNLMHIRAVGVVDVKDGALTFEVFRTLELDLFSGATTVSADFALGIRADVDFPFDESNADPLIVTGALPVDGEPAADPADNIIITFNEPVDVSTLPGVTLTNLTAGTDVPIQVRSTGSAVVVTPLSPMALGADFQLNLGASIADMGLYEPSPLMLTPDDATQGDGMLNFTTSSYLATAKPDAAPVLIGMYPGIGCALVDTDQEEGKAGRCAGGIGADEAANDDTYEPDYLYSDFLYDVSRPIELTFNQPMDLATIEPGIMSADGSQCETGSICLGESVQGSWTTIPFSLQKNPLRVRAYPEPNRITEGQQYRIVINGGNDAAGVFRNGLGYALNTDPLTGIGNPDGEADGGANAGGPNIVLDITAVPDNGAIFATVITRDYTDVNGNGYQDDAELPAEKNNATANIKEFGGLITDASLANGGVAYTSAGLPMAFLEKEPIALDYFGLSLESRNGDQRTWCADDRFLDENDEVFCITTEGDFMIPVEINPEIVMGTNLVMTATVAGLVPLELDTGPLVLRFSPYFDQALRDTPLRGFVINEAGAEEVQFIARLDALMDAPDVEILGGLGTGNVRSVRLSSYIQGPVQYQPNGKIALVSDNRTAMAADLVLNINTDFLEDQGVLPGVIGDLLAPVTDLISSAIPAPATATLALEPRQFRIRVVNSHAKALMTTAGQLDSGAQQ